MEKIDLYKEHKDEYVKPTQPMLVQTKPAKYLAAVGRGKPGSDEFKANIGALFGLAYTIKMTRKFSGGQDFKVCTLEGLYWADDPQRCIVEQGLENFNWKLMIRVPSNVRQNELTAAAKLAEKGKEGPFGNVVLETMKEGKCVQILHIGPYDAEAETVARMQAFCSENGLEFAGYHHEIYLSDPQRVAPEKLKTILRQPVTTAKKGKAAGA
ncbi:MAG TPA: GyrI-like domain-containing protein [Bryobacteraceae bacterium]|nr:GyrI-like domain-containing protein [Bryobacteraceae bacterium]